MGKLLAAIVLLYRAAFRPFVPRCCRFHPTCSEYALDAVHRHGGMRGFVLAFRRVLRCNPWHPGGHDPVP